MNRRILLQLTLVAFLGITIASTAIATKRSRTSGSWGSSSTWIQVRTGSISFTSGDSTVTGVGTLFTTELAVGDSIALESAPNTMIGRVSVRNTNTSLTLTTASPTSGSGTYGRRTATAPSNEPVFISNGTTVTTSSATITDLTVETGGIIGVNATQSLRANGDLVLNGVFQGPGTLRMGSGNSTISGSGSTTASGLIDLSGNPLSVLAGSNLDLSGTSSVNLRNNVVVTNNGVVSAVTIAGASATSTWINAAGARVNVGSDIMATGKLTATANGNTVAYNGAGQAIKVTSYYNLTLSGSGAVTIGASTVNGTFSLQGTATASAAPTYGPSAVLEYQGSSVQTTGPEFLAAMTNNVVINNANGVSLNASKVLFGTLTLTDGALSTGSFKVTLNNTAAAAVVITGGSINGEIVRSIAATSTGTYLCTDANTYLSPNGSQGAVTLSVKSFPSTDAPSDPALNAIKRYFVISPSASLSGTMRLAYLDGEVRGGQNENTYTLWSYDGTAWVDMGASSRSSGSNWVEQTVSNPTGNWTVSEAGSPLPITLASFVATATGTSTAQLDWRTISEVNNYGFEVQRAAQAAGQYQTISALIPGRGTTNAPQSYSFVDNSPLSGANYYRLRQIDLDRTVHLSDPVLVSIAVTPTSSKPGEFALSQNYPNPFNPVTEIRFTVANAGQTKLVVFNAIGQEVGTLYDAVAEAGPEYAVKFDGGALASGLYFYRLTNGASTQYRKMLLVR